MNEFKEWYEEINGIKKFKREFRLYFSQCTIKHEISFAEMLKLASDIAVEDYRERGMSIATLFENDYIILVSRMSLRIHKMPVGDQKLTLTTWEETPEAFQLKRCYQFCDENGTPLIDSVSAWIIVSPTTRRIVPTKLYTLRTPPSYTEEHNCMEPGKIQIPSELVQLNQRPICYSDLDGNGHTNNSRYGAFTIDCLPPEYQEKQFTDFRINFAKEAMIGDMLQMYAAFDTDNKKIIVVGKKISNNEICFESELYYK
ncbi:MAG: acyl-[acyl-carrier-protein] thioesterase [Treponema sp.]|nr:acyl-[acyl-carrier-protein] thioesterase [Treponema sp.]